MALVIETGALISGASSFVTREEIIAYALARGVVLADEDATDVLAVDAMDYLWAQCFKGELVSPTQTTPFPRTGLVDGDDADGYEHAIPHGVKNAQLQLALDSNAGLDLRRSTNSAPVLKRSKVGPIEREFFAPNYQTLDGTDPLTIATRWLAPFACSGGAFDLKTVRV